MKDPPVKLKLAHAKTLRSQLLDGAPPIQALSSALNALDAAISAAEKLAARKKAKPLPQAHRKPSSCDRKAKRHEKRASKALRTKDVREAVEKRANGVCECGCWRFFDQSLDGAAQMDDFFGGAKHRNEQECWMLRADCHREKTDNTPSRKDWLVKFAAHCQRYRYLEERRRALDKRDSLDAMEAAALFTQATEARRG